MSSNPIGFQLPGGVFIWIGASLIILKFKNWGEYQKRHGGIKNPIWFSFANDFATNKNFHSFSDSERLIFIYLLCEASKENDNGQLSIDIDHFSYITKNKTKDILSCIEKLKEKQILEDRDRDAIGTRSDPVQNAITTGQDKTGQDNTSSENSSHRSEEKHPEGIKLKPSDLVDLWNDLKHESLPGVMGLSPDREIKARARLKVYPDPDPWEKAMQMINNSKFLTGKTPPREGIKKTWKATFDWLIKPGNLERILEGTYQ
mgnify:CR=1 FL=1